MIEEGRNAKTRNDSTHSHCQSDKIEPKIAPYELSFKYILLIETF